MHVFIAHSNDDKRMARELAEKLRARDIDVLLDEDSLPSAEDYDGRIRAAIGACRVFVFLASPSSIKPGVYALTELKIAKRRWPNPAGRVLPVVVGGVSIEQLPPYLTQGVTVLRPMGNVVAETADEVERLLGNSGFGRHAKALLLGSSGIAVIALLGLGASLLASRQDDSGHPLPSTTVSSPDLRRSIAANASESRTRSLPDARAQAASLSSLLVSPTSEVQPAKSAAPPAASIPSAHPIPVAPRPSSSPVASTDFPLPSKIADAGWKRVGMEKFLPTSNWMTRVGREGYVRPVTLRIVDGKYRITVNFDASRRKVALAPYRTVLDLFAAVDIRLVSSTVEKPEICLVFGSTPTQDYGFCVHKFANAGWLRLYRYDGSVFVNLIDWTRTDAKLEDTNRIAVLVESKRIQLFMNAELVGEHQDSSFTGGTTALAVQSNDTGHLVVDFDNFELRVPPG